MKKLLSVILAVLILAACSVTAFAAASHIVESLVIEYSSGEIAFSGTTSNVSAAVAVQVLDGSGNVIGMTSAVISSNAFSGTVAYSGTPAKVRAASYDGGAWKTADVKHFTGTITVTGTPKVGETLTATISGYTQIQAAPKAYWRFEKNGIPTEYLASANPQNGSLSVDLTTAGLSITDGQLAALVGSKVSLVIHDNGYFEDPASVQTAAVAAADPLPPIILPPADDEDKPCDGGDKCSLKSFTDLDTSEWYHDSVHFCVENGIMNGTSDTTFDPAGTTTRAQLVTMLWRLEGKPYVNYLYGFKDVEPEQWYTEAIRWAAAEKIVNGYDAETFGTNDSVTREQTAAILYRYADYKGIDIDSYTENVNTLSFDDVFEISEFAAPGMHFCIAAHILQGSDNQLRPQAFASRVEMAAIIMRFDALLD